MAQRVGDLPSVGVTIVWLGVRTVWWGNASKEQHAFIILHFLIVDAMRQLLQAPTPFHLLHDGVTPRTE